MAAASPSSHPAFDVDISSFIKTTLEFEKGDEYTIWSELFKIQARACQVLDHILPSTNASSSTSLKKTDPGLWSRLDAIVLQWIYSTISNDLLHAVIEPDSSAEIAWNRLKDIFSDNNFTAVRLANRVSETLKDDDDPGSFSEELVVFDEYDNRYLVSVWNHDTGSLMTFHVNTEWEIFVKDFDKKQGQVFQIYRLFDHTLVPGRLYYTLKPLPADHSKLEKGSVLSMTLNPQNRSALYIDASEAYTLTNYASFLEPSPSSSSVILSVFDEDDNRYNMLLSYCDVNVYAISRGWGRFVKDQKLKPGDRVFFHRFFTGEEGVEPFYDIKYIRKEELEMTKVLSAHRGNIVGLCFDASEALLLTGCSWVFGKYPLGTVLMNLEVYDDGDRPYDMVLTHMKRDDGAVTCTLDGGWHRFVWTHGLKAGDKVTINRVQGELYYVLSYTRAGGESGVGPGGSGQKEA